MPFVYTTRKGKELTLYCGKMKSGKQRFYFAASSTKGEPCEEIPQGFEVRESPNGIVTLARIRPSLFSEEEREAVRVQLSMHPHAADYELYSTPDRMVIYERLTLGYENLHALFEMLGLEDTEDARQKFDVEAGVTARYEEVLRFIMVDPKERLIHVERMCYLGGVDDWYLVEGGSDIRELAQKTIPLLGTDEFYDLN
jgi:hypothetical protein